ncbi:MAG: hypothetical protein JW809_07785 [Pirellulales bacterium]|nr:hypothetical protein [Pirellulales bacterium]
MLVALRLTIGWHFLYEGVWKIANYDEFSTTPFLEQAKGPAADFYYAMIHDVDGRERLAVEKDEKGKPIIPGRIYLDAWKNQLASAIDKYGLRGDQKTQAEKLYERYAKSLAEYLADNQDAILGYFNSLDRFEAARAAGGDNADYHKKRVWDEQQKLRAEVGGWLAELDAMGEEYRLGLHDLLDEEQRKQGPVPVAYDREDAMNFLMTFALTAIGVCLMTGFCTRLACLGGGVFLINVVLTQPPWPTIYPPAPAVTGHSLVVDKNFVEMVAIFMLACLPVGRWGGLDFFVYRWFGRPVLRWLGRPVE